MNKFLKKITAAVLVMGIVFSSFAANTINAKAATKKDVVVVLDPGHDTTHHGCQYAGLDEGTINYLIAYYAMLELKKYSGVQVYMTRNTTACAYGADPNSASACLAGRVNLATKVGANVFVSIHNDYDADGDTSVNGCKVIYQNANYRKDLCLNGYKLGQQVLAQLQTTGLKVNNWKMDPNGTGLVTRTSTNATYPDGSAKDYYAVLNQTKSAGITGIIIEHAYMSNDSDRLNHLTTATQLQQLGVADATAIANYYGLKKN